MSGLYDAAASNIWVLLAVVGPVWAIGVVCVVLMHRAHKRGQKP